MDLSSKNNVEFQCVSFWFFIQGVISHGKKILSYFLIITLLLSTITFPLIAGAVNVGALITSSDDFSDLTLDKTKWTVSEANSSVLDVITYPDGTNKCLYFMKADNSKRDYAQSATILAVDPANSAYTLDENDVVEVKAKLATRNVRGGAKMEIFSNNGKSIASVVMGPYSGVAYDNNYPTGISVHTGGYTTVTGIDAKTRTVIDKTALNLLPVYTLST